MAKECDEELEMLWLARGHWLTSGLLTGVTVPFSFWMHLPKWLTVLLIFLSMFPAVLASALWWNWMGRKLGIPLSDDEDDE